MSQVSNNQSPKSVKTQVSGSESLTAEAFTIENGWLQNVEQQTSPHYQPREMHDKVSLLVVHNISLPPGQFGGPYITDLFLGKLDPEADEYFADIYQLRVSAHCLIRRDGKVIQYVSFDDKAWHAGISVFDGREKCNDFSIGIELEGTDTTPYTDAQYQKLAQITAALRLEYPLITAERITGHSDIAPGRKTDPGSAFDWQFFNNCLYQIEKKSV